MAIEVIGFEAHLVGGPNHGEQRMVRSHIIEVAIPLPVPIIPTFNPTLSAPYKRGVYVARTERSFGEYRYVRLPNGYVPFDWEGPAGPTWHERKRP